MSGMELESNRLLSFAPTRSRRFGLPSHGAWPLAPTTFPALTPALLARAGWYFTPSKSSPDQVTCFLCKKSLGGWEPADDAFVEHVGHGRDCGWAGTRCQVEVRRRAEGGADDDDETKGVRWSLEAEGGTRPAEMEKARRATFGKWWPHDKAKGWTPTSTAMAKAGFVFTPTAEAPDLATCLYCELGLDGWEPSDDPFQEHLKRTPKCPFFAAVAASSSSARPAVASTSAAKPAAKGGKRPAVATGKKRAPSLEPAGGETGEDDDEDAFEMIDMPSPPAAKTPKPTRASRQSKAPSAATSTTTTTAAASRTGRSRTTTAPTPAPSASTAKTKAKPAKASSAAAAPSKKEKPLPPSPEREPSSVPDADEGSEDGVIQEKSRRPASPGPEPAPKTRKPAKAAKGKTAAPPRAAPSPVGDEASDEGAIDDGLNAEAGASVDQERAPKPKPAAKKKVKAASAALAEPKAKARGKKAAAVVDASETEEDGFVEEEEPKKAAKQSAPSTAPTLHDNKAVHEREASGSSALTSLPSSSSTGATLVKSAIKPAKPSSSSSSARPPSLGRPVTVRSPPPPAQLARPRPMSPPATAASTSTSTPNGGTPSRLPVRSNLVSPRSPQQMPHQHQHPAPSFGQVASTATAPPPAQPKDDVFSAPVASALKPAPLPSSAASAKASSSRTGSVPVVAPTPIVPPAADDDEPDLDLTDEEGDLDVETAVLCEPFDDEELDVQAWIQQAFRRRADEMAEEHERAKQAFLERALEARRLIEEESCDESGDESGGGDDD